MRTIRLVATALTVVLVMTGTACSDDDDGSTDAADSTTTSAVEAGKDEATSTSGGTPSGTTPAETALTANLSGAAEVPGPGLDDGSGVAKLTVKGPELCFDLNAAMGERPTAAHIHKGSVTESGPVVVNLQPAFGNGESGFVAQGCTTPDAAALSQITGEPAGFYVNIHSAEHPDGAIRGQLAAA